MTPDIDYERFCNEVIAAMRTTLAADSAPATQTGADGVRVPPWAGFRFVDIARLGDSVLIAFHWHETGDQIFVYVAALKDFADSDMSVSLTNQIISAHIFELMGDGWHLQVPTTHIHGLTFIEPRQGRDR